MSKPRHFRCLIGDQARRDLERDGVTPDSFKLMLAASGGPRWLGLVGIDRALTGFLRQRSSTTRFPLLGSSSGAWRVTAMACDSHGAAYDELQDAYIEQRYEGKPTPAEVSQTCREYLGRIFTRERLEHATHRSPFHANFTTAILRKEQPGNLQMLSSLLALPFLNAYDRTQMGRLFARGLFSAGEHPHASPLLGAPFWDDYPTRAVTLDSDNFVSALLASGSIPFVLAGESSIPGAGTGHHIDGGLVDYHFEVETSGPILYPHFSDDPMPGWMDRFPPFRRLSRAARSKLCLLLPSDELISGFPDGRYPGRIDFTAHSNDDRIRRWTSIVESNAPLEAELSACLEAGDLLKIAQRF